MTIKLSNTAGDGSSTIKAPDTVGDKIFTLPDETGTGLVETEVDGKDAALQSNIDAVQSNVDLRTRKNLIINGSFDIWQRGSSSSGSGYIAADRWKSNSSTTSFARLGGGASVPWDYSLKMTRSASGAYSAITTVELPVAGLPGPFIVGAPVVLSFWAYSSLAHSIMSTSITFSDDSDYTNAQTIYSKSDHEIGAGVWTKYEVPFNIAGTPVGTSKCVRININSGNQAAGEEFRIAQVQFELGDAASTFEQLSIQEQLLLCVRYFKVVHQGTACAYGWSSTATEVYIGFPLAVPMYKEPSLVFTNIGSNRLYINGTAKVPLDATMDGISNTHIEVKYTVSGAALYHSVVVRNYGCEYLFDAEI